MAGKSNLDEQGNFLCPRCKQHKPLEDFYKTYGAQRGRKSPYCKVCANDMDFISKQRAKIRLLGPEEYRNQIDREQRLLSIRYQILTDFLGGRNEI